MRLSKLLFVVFSLVPALAIAQPERMGVLIQDEATPRKFAHTLKFTGTPITCTVTGGIATCDIVVNSGAGNFVATEVDFGAHPGNYHTNKVVTGQTWVTSNSTIVCNVTDFATADRADGSEEAAIENLTIAVRNRVASTGFTIDASVPRGRAQGKFAVHCTGG